MLCGTVLAVVPLLRFFEQALRMYRLSRSFKLI